MDLDTCIDWLSLSMTQGLGSRLIGKLLRQFGSPERIFRASLTELEACQLPSVPARAIQARQAHKEAQEELNRARNLGCQLINWSEPEYPQRLLEIYDPPPLLYVRGDVSVLNRHSISMVGTRRPTPYGNQVAERLGRDLAERGLTIVSGMARGVDSSSHQGACKANHGGAVGVLGTGVDVVYPKENKRLFAEVEKRGALISEFPLGTHPAPENFPVRNRVVAGMSLGVVVVQGAQYSGSLITARLGMEFGREVYGVPGNITSDVSFAPNQLIKQGAKLVTSWEDVIEELPTAVRAELFPVEETTGEERASLFVKALSPVEKKVFGLLGVDDSIQVDELVERSELTSSEVLAALCEMEMKGMVRQMPGKLFIKVLQ
ncbi:MAG: DNA-processing protein DprA [Candidatus Acidiferrales bacterium]